MTFELPPPAARLEVDLDDSARIRVRRHGNPNGPRVLIAHGNGFAINGYYPYWRLLLAEYDLLVFDFRNHGENDPVDPPNHDYDQFTRDLEHVIMVTRARLGEKPTAGIFHSMSARTAMKHAIEIGWRWDALVLFDPPDVPPPDHPHFKPMKIFEEKLVEWALNRRRRFASIEELTAEYLQSRATRKWVPGVHALMAHSVLRRHPEGGYALVCTPENEAKVYALALSLNLWPHAREFGGPVKLIGADPTMKGAPATGPANQALAREGGFDYAFVEGTGHLLQIEKPEACARITLDFFAKCGFR